MSQNPGIDTLVETIKSGGNIVDFARKFGITVAVASRYIAKVASVSEKTQQVLERWPKNVTSGYVFIGDKHKTVGENSAKGSAIPILQKGDYVLGELWNKKRGYYEIFMADEVIETKFVFGYKDLNGNFRPAEVDGELLVKWFCDADIQRAEALRFGKEYNCNSKYRTDSTRIGYRKGLWLGNVSSHALIPVNYNWT